MLESFLKLITDYFGISFDGPNPFLFVRMEIFVGGCAVLSAAIIALLLVLFIKNLKGFWFFIIIWMMFSGGIAYSFYDKALNKYIDYWLSQERVYQILFKDFPKDRERFVGEYRGAFLSGGYKAVNEKYQEMKIIMSVNHLKTYIQKTPHKIIYKHVQALANLYMALYRTDPELCHKYLGYTGHFNEVWEKLGGQLFLESVKYLPEMIVAAHDAPEYPVWLLNRAETYDASREIRYMVWDIARKQYSVKDEDYKKPEVVCLINALNYAELVKMDHDKAALIWKYWFQDYKR